MKRKADIFLIAMMVALMFAAACNQIFSADISDESIVVYSPVDSLFTKKTSITWSWEENDKIERYRLRLSSPDFITPDFLQDTTFSGQQLKQTLEAGKYTWQMQGVNEGSETEWVSRIFFIDLAAPDKATALSFNGDTIASGSIDTLRWSSRDQAIEGIRYPVADSVYISLVNDSLLWNEAEYVGYSGDREWPAIDAAGDPFAVGKYFWYIVTMDKAGNTKKSDVFHFVIQ